MKFLKMSVAGIQVPEITYVDKSGRKIVVQGAIHIGDRKFYEKVIDQMKSFEGEIHLEGIRSTDETLTDKKILLDSLYSILASIANTEYQKNYINKNILQHKKIFNHDIADTEVIDDVIDDELLQKLRDHLNNGLKKTLMNKYFLGFGSAALPPFIAMAAGSDSFSEMANEEIIIDRRNEYALEKAFEANDNGESVYLFWGAKHIEGMHEILIEKGYSVERVKWRTALSSVRTRSLIQQRTENIVQKISIIEGLLN